jgi:putative ABC transport system permease protein
VIGRISLVIRFLAGFSVATGFIVLLGAVSTSRLQRIRESVLLKTIGATRRQIGAILFVEYFALGLLAAVTGIALATVAGWALARWFFSLEFVVAGGQLAVLGGAVALLAVAIGVWASREVFQRTPLEAIREE